MFFPAPLCQILLKEKSLKPLWFQGFFEISALAELGRAAGGFEAVLFVVCRLKPLKTQAFFALTSKITSIVTSKWGYFLKTQARYGTFGMVMLVCIK